MESASQTVHLMKKQLGKPQYGKTQL